MSRLDTDPARWVRPTKYVLDYDDVDLEEFTFHGRVRIVVAVEKEAGTSIKLHAKGLEIPKAELVLQDDSVIHAEEIVLHKDEELVEIKFHKPQPQVSHITVWFKGNLDDSLAGLYRSFYTNDAGEKRAMAVTQFEATDARRAFPCFDEPNMKARMELSVTTDMSRTCVSNTPVVFTRTDVKTKKKYWKFAETPILSTYLVALLIGDFDVVSGYSSRGVLTSVYTRPGRAREGLFALDVACRALDFYEKEYGIEYPLKKQDLAAIPDFAAGAMENWGLVTYREQRLMVDNTTSEAAKLSVARVVGHENAHMWFGNLVTMEYWTDLWLNEGFARFMEFNCVNHLFPEWQVWTVFVQDIQSLALRLDSMSSTHPVRVEVNTPDQISEIFDAISYAKGASIIRMLESFLGHDNFMKGVQHYLKTFSYQNAVTDDLWRCIEEANPQVEKGSVRDLMASWTGKEGYPVILLSQDNDNTVQVSVEQFKYNLPSSNDGSVRLDAKEAGAAWQIPLKVSAAGDSELTRMTLHGEPSLQQLKTMLDTKLGDGQWVTLNTDMTGFFRVCYTEKQWKLLLTAMQDRKDMDSAIPSLDPESLRLSPSDRLGLVRDAFSCASSGYMPVTIPLTLARGLLAPKTVEKDAAVLLELVRWLSALADLYRDEPFYAQFADQLIYQCCAPIFQELKWASRSEAEENLFSMALRSQVLKALSKVPSQVLESGGDAGKLVPIAVDLVTNHCSGGKTVGPDERLAVFQLAAKDKSKAEEMFAMMHTRHLSEEIAAEERRDLLQTLASFAGHDELLDRVMHFAFSDVRIQDFAMVVHGICNASYPAAKKMWTKFSSEFDMMWEKYSSVSFLWGSIVEGVVGGLRTLEDLQEVQGFFEDREKGSAARSLERAMERIQARLDRLARDAPQVQAFLSS